MENESKLMNVPFSPLPDLYFKAYNLANAAARLQVSVRDILQITDAQAFDWLISLDPEKIESYKRDPKTVASNANFVNTFLTHAKLIDLKQKLLEYE